MFDPRLGQESRQNQERVEGAREAVRLYLWSAVIGCLSIGPNRFWYVKLKALTEVRDWEGLEAMAKSKKSPIGYEVSHFI